jgi:hypothetical protein
MKTATILALPRTSKRRFGLLATGIESTPVFPTLTDAVPTCVDEDRTIRESQQRQETQAETDLLPKLAAKAHEKGLSLFEYLADLAPEGVGARQFLSPE